MFDVSDGFDVVVGNPPYVRHEDIKVPKPLLKTNYKTYSGTADLYVYFVELAFNLLQKGGHLAYIIQDKWMQAGYGKPLRSYLLKQAVKEIIDFGDVQVFESATTYACILRAQKAEMGRLLQYTSINEPLTNADTLQNRIEMASIEFNTNNLTNDTWMLSGGKETELLERIWGDCLKLEEYIGNEVCRGVTTGLTEAFLIDGATQKTIIKEHAPSKKLLKPVLRGKSISPWYSKTDDKYLIGTFPALGININDYPPVKAHLLSYGKKRLEQSGVGNARKKTGYKWFETQDGIQYWREFERPKIMYQKFQVKPCFIFDDQGLYCNDSMWIITKDDKLLLGILNSKLGWWLISKYCTKIQNGYQLIWKYLGQIPIPKTMNSKTAKEIDLLVNKIITKKKAGIDISKEEADVDRLVLALYGLGEEDILIPC